MRGCLPISPRSALGREEKDPPSVKERDFLKPSQAVNSRMVRRSYGRFLFTYGHAKGWREVPRLTCYVS